MIQFKTLLHFTVEFATLVCCTFSENGLIQSFFVKIEQPSGQTSILWNPLLEDAVKSESLEAGQYICLGHFKRGNQSEFILKTVDKEIHNQAPMSDKTVFQVKNEFNSINQVLPTDQIKIKSLLTEVGVTYNGIKIIDSARKQELISEVECTSIKEELKKQTDADSIYQIAGKFISSGQGKDPFYKNDSYYILLRTPEGKLKSVWGQRVSKVIRSSTA